MTELVRSQRSIEIDVLADQGRSDELRAEVDAGTPGATERLTDLLAEAGEELPETGPDSKGGDQPQPGGD